jgi:hypothetical protein
VPIWIVRAKSSNLISCPSPAWQYLKRLSRKNLRCHIDLGAVFALAFYLLHLGVSKALQVENNHIRQFAQSGLNACFRFLSALLALVLVFKHVFPQELLDALFQGGFERQTQSHEGVVSNRVGVALPAAHSGLLHASEDAVDD